MRFDSGSSGQAPRSLERFGERVRDREALRRQLDRRRQVLGPRPLAVLRDAPARSRARCRARPTIASLRCCRASARPSRRGTCCASPSAGAFSRKSMNVVRPSAMRISMKPPPPRLPANGCVTASAKPTATAASTALPPLPQHREPGLVGRLLGDRPSPAGRAPARAPPGELPEGGPAQTFAGAIAARQLWCSGSFSQPTVGHACRPSVLEAEGDQRVARNHRDVLLAVDRVGDRPVDDLAAEARLPQHGAGARVERVEVAFAAAGEQQVGRRGQDAAVGDVELLELPLLLAGLRIDARSPRRGRRRRSSC